MTDIEYMMVVNEFLFPIESTDQFLFLFFFVFRCVYFQMLLWLCVCIYMLVYLMKLLFSMLTKELNDSHFFSDFVVVVFMFNHWKDLIHFWTFLDFSVDSSISSSQSQHISFSHSINWTEFTFIFKIHVKREENNFLFPSFILISIKMIQFMHTSTIII